MRILFVHNALRSFVAIDRDFLAEVHDVDEFDLSNRLLLRELRGRLAQADLIFAWFASVPNLVPILTAWALHIPSIVVVGGYDTARLPEINFGHMAHPWKRHVVRAICRYASHLLVNSWTAHEELTRHVGTFPHVSVLHHGFRVPLNPINCNRIPVALSVGHVRWDTIGRKGHIVFVDAAALLPDVQFILVGCEYDGAGDYLRSIAPPNVELAGYLPSAAVEDLNSRASAYVQASKHEAFGCAVAEAMAYGCIPVVSRRAALPEIVGDHGIYVDEDDSRSVAEGIRRSLSASCRDRQAVANRVAETFSWEQRRHGLLDLVCEVRCRATR